MMARVVRRVTSRSHHFVLEALEVEEEEVGVN